MKVLASSSRASQLQRKTAVRQPRPRSTVPVIRATAAVQPSESGKQYEKLTSMDDEGCRVFIDRDGTMLTAMCADYGFRAGAGRLYQEHYGERPKGVWSLAVDNFQHELLQLRRYTRFPSKDPPLHPPQGFLPKAAQAIGGAMTSAFGALDKALEDAKVLPQLSEPPTRTDLMNEQWLEIRSKLSQLQLDNDAVARREAAREAVEGKLESPLWVKVPFYALCWVLDVLYVGRPIQKFWVLETVARIPYFAYISILHLYESLGFWRAGAELRKVHFAEEWNEMHHLQIMESLGGDQAWFDRFLGEHCALLYYWVLIGFYLISPKLAYNFMERVEHHAADTYTEFLEANRTLLSEIPPPYVALNYYRTQDLYLFDEFQRNSTGELRRPECNNLMDVFTNIRDDELEHVKTMSACQEETIADKIASQRGSPKI